MSIWGEQVKGSALMGAYVVGASMTRASSLSFGGSSEVGSSRVSHIVNISFVVESVGSAGSRYSTWSSFGRVIMGLLSPILVMKLAELKVWLPTSIILVSLDGGWDGRGF